MKKIVYLWSMGSILFSSLLHAGTYSHMRNVAHWTGYYMGVNGGYNWSTNNIIQSSASPSTNRVLRPELNPYFSQTLTGAVRSSPHGLMGGLQVAYNYEQAYKYLYGLEADIDVLQQNDNVDIINRDIVLHGLPHSIHSSFTLTKVLSYVGSVRLRAGYMLTPKWAAYGTGGFGYGFGNLKGAYGAIFVGDPNILSISKTKTGAIQFLPGWALGGGVEWMFKPYWVVRIETLYYDLGSINKTVNATEYVSLSGSKTPYSEASINISVPFQIITVRAAMSYRFA